MHVEIKTSLVLGFAIPKETDTVLGSAIKLEAPKRWVLALHFPTKVKQRLFYVVLHFQPFFVLFWKNRSTSSPSARAPAQPPH